MSARGNFRGGYGGQYPVRGHYNQGPQSSGHATPNSSFHGPSNQFSQSPYRGGYRSSSGGYRGNSVGAGRGGNRGGFKSGHWGSSGSGSRAASSQPDDTGSGRGTPRAGSIAGDQVSVHSDSAPQEADNPFRPPKELQVEDTTKDENNETQPMPPPTGRLPPTGPAAEKKISFALKPTSKPPVATPKLEISSKFNAPARRDPPKEPSPGIPETIETTGTNENEIHEIHETHEINEINESNESNENNENTEITESGPRPNMPQKVEICPGMCRLNPVQLRWLGSRGNVRSSKSLEIPENLVCGW
ncbi:hypothetical protein VPNG_02273 [Cytospora leucostoma]|uniref:Uncharacterized protein n=1 Tax=Cytospora leucostoma TaxID=1230097 RepID=A0A423XH04_9PEZI|nr:hypothetical protein VPNG_02273 [Cytospora leucostoma]